MKTKKRLVLLDAHAIIHRAYHALPEFTSPSGEPTGALYGLSSMLLRIIDDLQPDYIASCYDLPKPTIRHEAYAEYKGTRQKTDDALVAQIIRSRVVFETFGIPIYDREGYEADDILGTLAHELKSEKDLDIVIASGDMDTLQLIDGDRVQVYTLKKGLNDTILYDEEAVMKRFGFGPTLIPDYKGLRGDPSDNIKGIPGVGEKTATDLIVNFGSVEDIYKKLKKDEKAFLDAGVKPRMIQLLKDHEEDARFSKMLATIRTDAPISFRLENCVFRDEKRLPTILALFDELGFRSLRGRAQSVFGNREGLEDKEDGDSPPLSQVEEPIDEVMFREAQILIYLLRSEFTNASLEDILAYARTESLPEAHANLLKEVMETGRLGEVYEHIEKPLVPILMDMKERGVGVDKKALAKLSVQYHEELDAIQKKIYKSAGKEFNVSSPKQLGEVLFDDMGLTAKGQKKTAGGQRSTKESELEKIKDLHPIVADVLEYRELQKLLSTYIDSIPLLLDKENRLHAEFLQTGTTTGRMGCQNPNLQNIPIKTERGRVIRNAFVAPKDFSIVALDYSQIELRLAAILSRDEKLCEIFKNGRDVHTEVAVRVFNVEPEKVDAEMRRKAKAINFGMLYGMGVNSLKTALGSTIGEAHTFYDTYFATFTKLTEYLESTKGFARKNGYTETLFGRRRSFPEMKSPLPYVRAQAERMAINAPMQGTQSDIIKLAMVQVQEMFEKEKAIDDAHMLLQIHDELVFEIKTERVKDLTAKIRSIMEKALPSDMANGVPIIVEAKVGANWGEMEKV